MSKASLQAHTVHEPVLSSAATHEPSACRVQVKTASHETDQLARLAAAIRADAGRSAADYVQRVNTEQHGE